MKGRECAQLQTLEQERMEQARSSLEDAQACLEAGMDTGRVLTNLYYAYYYPVLALTSGGRVPEAMQSVMIGLFERTFIETGIVRREHLDALRRTFESKPKCNGERTHISRGEVEQLMARARSFQAEAQAYLDRTPTDPVRGARNSG